MKRQLAGWFGGGALALLLLFALAVQACSSSIEADVGPADSSGDTAPVDVGPVDSSRDTTTPPDVGPPDVGSPDVGPPGQCTVASDCGWGEIGSEIRSASECVCLFGCPSLPLNRMVIARRLAQYASLCDPSMDGMGNPCPIDDCLMPPPLACIDNVCVLAPGDAGP